MTRSRRADDGTPLRVLVVTTVHTPLDARIHHRQIGALVAAGVQVTYAAPFRATDTAMDAVRTGVSCLDLPRAVGRRRIGALRAARRTIARIGPDHDLVLLHDAELVGAVIGRLRRLPPVVLDVHEDLPAALADDRAWVPRPLRRVARAGVGAAERWAEHALAGLLLAEASYQRRFRGAHAFVPNLPWLPHDPPPPGTQDRVVCLGRVSRGRGAAELLALGERLTAAGGPRLELIGPADADVRAELEAADRAGHLRWHGFVANERALELVAGSVAGLAPLHDLPNYRGSLPTKVLEYLSLGVPAVVTPLPASIELIGVTGAGEVVAFGDVEAMTAAVLQLAADDDRRRELGARGRQHVAAHHSWDAHAGAFVAELHRLAGRSAPSGPTDPAAG